MQAQRNKLHFEGQKIFVGIDVHKKERNIIQPTKQDFADFGHIAIWLLKAFTAWWFMRQTFRPMKKKEFSRRIKEIAGK